MASISAGIFRILTGSDDVHLQTNPCTLDLRARIVQIIPTSTKDSQHPSKDPYNLWSHGLSQPSLLPA